METEPNSAHQSSGGWREGEKGASAGADAGALAPHKMMILRSITDEPTACSMACGTHSLTHAPRPTQHHGTHRIAVL